MDFVNKWYGKPLEECKESLESLRDKIALRELVVGLMAKPGYNRDWLHDVAKLTEVSYVK